MFSYIYNRESLDLYLFFNYELLVVICFFFFLFFAILAENGQISSYFDEISHERRSILSRHLSNRLILLRDLSFSLDISFTELRKIFFSYDNTSLSLLFFLQCSAKELSLHTANLHVRSYLETLTLRTEFLSSGIRSYITREFTSTLSSATFKSNILIID